MLKLRPQANKQAAEKAYLAVFSSTFPREPLPSNVPIIDAVVASSALNGVNVPKSSTTLQFGQPTTTTTRQNEIGTAQLCQCGCEVCSADANQRLGFWVHSRSCKRPKVCGIVLCEKLQNVPTDDMLEAFAKLERDVHPPAFKFIKKPDSKRENNFAPINADFARRDSDYFGTEHIDLGTSVLVTGLYYPESATLKGSWCEYPVRHSADASPAKKGFVIHASNGNVEDKDASRPCVICNSAVEGSNNAIILCDLCDSPFHIGCIHLAKVPEADYFCRDCLSLKQRLGSDIPPTRDWAGQFGYFDPRKNKVVEAPDKLHLDFDYVSAKGELVATISGKGRNLFGVYYVKGVLKRSSGKLVFQFSKNFKLQPHQITSSSTSAPTNSVISTG